MLQRNQERVIKYKNAVGIEFAEVVAHFMGAPQSLKRSPVDKGIRSQSAPLRKES
jgi:hypothetical protein